MSTTHPYAAKTLRSLTIACAAVSLTLAFLSSARAASPTTSPDLAQVVASSSSTPKRLQAYNYSLAQKGDWYQYGATGPSTWDCSGLPYIAYKRVGLPIPRTTQDMLRDSRDVFYRTNHPRKGDLAFFGSGHVELYVSGTLYNGTTFGAHKSGTRVGYRTYDKYYHPTTFLHRRNAG